MIPHKLKQKGTMFVEYAILLAFVAIVAAVFLDDHGLDNSISGTVNKLVLKLDGEKTDAEKIPVKTYGTGKGLSLEWLESEATRSLLKNVGQTYPTYNDSTYAGYQDNQYRNQLKEELAQQLGVNSNDITMTYDNGSDRLMYAVNQNGGPLSYGQTKVPTTIIAYNKDGSVNQIHTDISTFQGWPSTTTNSFYADKAGFWNSTRAENVNIAYKKE